ncbi:nucleotidyltransferase domain-containing protein [Sinorhizobium chiapasense]|uniref:Nucleotidyltransferase domain-containing protein n=1 Tax=Sinorhizobium chiapasense TaxID=501572 RepID=A0ABZ2BJ04_9HYPH
MARPTPDSSLRHPLNSVLGAESNVRLLRELCLHGGYISAPQLTGRTGLVRNSTWNALKSLRQYGLVVEEGTDRSRLFRINWEHPLADLIGQLFRAESERLHNIFEEIKAGGKKLNDRIASMWLYGSVARREDRADSDVDIGLIARPDDLAEVVEAVRELLREAGERLFFLPNVVGLDFDDVERMARDDDPWWKSCIGDAVVLSGKRPEDVAKELLRRSGDGQKRAE